MRREGSRDTLLEGTLWQKGRKENFVIAVCLSVYERALLTTYLPIQACVQALHPSYAV